MARILFDHIAIATASMESARGVLADALGGRHARGGLSPGYRWGAWRFKDGGCIEVLEPAGEEGFIQRFLARRGPGVHHVTFRVPSLREACQRAEAQGYTIVGYDDSDPEWAEAFLHPKQALGIVVQLAESRPSGRRSRRSPGPPDSPPAVTILGLRMRVHTRGSAQTQWEHVLRGECEEMAGGDLVYRWPGSSMRLTVEVDPHQEEGPISVEFASERPVVLPENPHPALGVELLERPRGGY